MQTLYTYRACRKAKNTYKHTYTCVSMDTICEGYVCVAEGKQSRKWYFLGLFVVVNDRFNSITLTKIDIS